MKEDKFLKQLAENLKTYGEVTLNPPVAVYGSEDPFFPDLVFRDSDNNHMLVVECKFGNLPVASGTVTSAYIEVGNRIRSHNENASFVVLTNQKLPDSISPGKYTSGTAFLNFSDQEPAAIAKSLHDLAKQPSE